MELRGSPRSPRIKVLTGDGGRGAGRRAFTRRAFGRQAFLPPAWRGHCASWRWRWHRRRISSPTGASTNRHSRKGYAAPGNSRSRAAARPPCIARRDGRATARSGRRWPCRWSMVGLPRSGNVHCRLLPAVGFSRQCLKSNGGVGEVTKHQSRRLGIAKAFAKAGSHAARMATIFLKLRVSAIVPMRALLADVLMVFMSAVTMKPLVSADITCLPNKSPAETA